MRRLLHGLLGATLLLGACGGDDDDSDRAAVTSIPEETTSSTSSTTTEPRTVAPDVIPQDESQITEEYVEQVLDELFRVSRDALVHTREATLVDETTIELLESIYTKDQAREAINGLIEIAFGDFANFQADPQPATADVLELIDRHRECVFAEVRFDSSGLVTNFQALPDHVRGFVHLLPATEANRAPGHNPTAWVIAALPATEDGTVPAETCSDPS